MPIYEYRCQACGHEFEKLVRLSDPVPPCPSCGALREVSKKVSLSAFALKGSGWARDHYGLKSSGSGGGDGGGKAGDAGASAGGGGASSGGGEGAAPAAKVAPAS